ncbi:putative membrane protein, partial [Yersinia pestis PY-29]
MGGAVGVAFVI